MTCDVGISYLVEADPSFSKVEIWGIRGDNCDEVSATVGDGNSDGLLEVSEDSYRLLNV